MLLYYLLIFPLSKLPLRLLYGISGFLYFIFRYVWQYRRKVMMANLERAFPDQSSEWREKLLLKNYRHLSRLLAEGIKNLGIGERELLQRMQVSGTEALQKDFLAGKSVILLSSHQQNWEYFITAQNLLLPHQAYGIGKPLSAAYLNQKINALRERFGMRVIHAHNYKEQLESGMKEGPLAVLVLADQAPAPQQAFWTPFFGIETPFAFGAELMANKYQMPVYFVDITQPRQGYYEADIRLLSAEPHKEAYGFITATYAHWLEAQIRQAPEAWLWSHKRWKHRIPEDLDQRKKEHEARFMKSFRNRRD